MTITAEAKLRLWLEKTLKGRVISCVSQQRWRDAWFVEFEQNGKTLQLYVRCDRNEEFPPEPIEYEAAVLKTLGEHDIPTPKIYGICPDPRAVIMEAVPGRHDLSTAENEQERVAVLEHLGEIMARQHTLDIAPFVQAGMRIPQTEEEIAIPYVLSCEQVFRKHKTAPEPRVEFFLRWLRRNIPPRPERLSVLQQDSGQFMFDKGRVIAMVDLELAVIGDPMQDIAALRQRSIAEPMGDIRPLLRRYVELSGITLDRQRVAFHSASWLIGSSVLMVPSLNQPKAQTNYPEYLSWYVGCMMSAMQAFAEHEGFELLEPEPTPVRHSSRWSPSLTSLAAQFTERDGGLAGYERAVGAALAQFQINVDAMGAWAEQEYCQDVAEIVGETVSNWVQADALFEAFVLQADRSYDRQIVEIIYRWLYRQIPLIDGLFAMPIGRMVPLNELLDI